MVNFLIDRVHIQHCIVILSSISLLFISAHCGTNYKVNKYAQWTVERHHLFTMTCVPYDFFRSCERTPHTHTHKYRCDEMTNWKLGEIGRYNKHRLLATAYLWHLSGDFENWKPFVSWQITSSAQSMRCCIVRWL